MRASVMAMVMAAGVSGAAFGQAPPANPVPAPERRAVRFEDLPAPARLGLKVDNARRVLAVVPVVVVVPDAASYAAAVAKWNVDPRAVEAGKPPRMGVRFPVLIDDGTWRAREDIARFVRGFEPTSVVRWSVGEEGAKAWPKEDAAVRARVEASAYGVWGAVSLDEMSARWKANKFAPPGVVVASAADPAWTAALALAAGHGEVIAWATAKPDLSGSMSPDEAAALNAAAMEACRASGFTWEGVGDEIDAVAVCMNVPASVRLSSGDNRKMLAMTDVVGRGAGGDAVRRWAWAGQVVGGEARAAYTAMCALFLQPKRAWVFDGYDNTEPKSRWDASAAAVVLEKAGIGTLLNDNGNQGAADWRNRAAGMGLAANSAATREAGSGVDAGFIAVNSSGHAEQFEVLPGQLRAGDVPFLNVPATVHFVHSFSAASPGNRATIAGRFLERGAFAYVGAVHEPYLQAFIPTPAMAERMLSSAPWAASVRLDDAPPWKVAVFGDPLYTMGAPAPRLEESVPLLGTEPVQGTLAPLLKEKNFEAALWALVMQGRDADAERLVRLLEKDSPSAVTEGVAAAGVMAVFRSPGREGAAGSGERLTLLSSLCIRLEKKYAATPELRDILWHAAYPGIAKLNEVQARALAGAVRPEHADRDAGELVRGARQGLGAAKAAEVLRAAKPSLPEFASKAIEGALGK